MTDTPRPPRRSGPLEDLVVLDLTRVRAGPACARQLADWGARVIKIETPEDGTGSSKDFAPRHDPDFQNLHRNKESLTLNLKAAKGKEIFFKLAAKADIVIENFRPDVKHRLGIDYDSISAINERVIYASISGFGQDGPYKDRPGVDQVIQGMSGLMSVTGEPSAGPMRAGIAIGDMSAGIFAANGILIAIIERAKSGKGQFVDASLLSSLIFMMDFQAARYTMNGDVAVQTGNDHPTGVPTGRFKASDGFINLAPTPPMWRKFCKILGQEDLADRPEFSEPAARRANRDALNAIIETFTSVRKKDELVELFNSHGVPCGPIYTMNEVFADAQVRHSGIATTVPSNTLGSVCLLGQPFALGRTPSVLRSCAPELGEHSEQILREFDVSADEIAQLRADGVL